MKTKSKVNQAGVYTKPGMRKNLFEKIKAGADVVQLYTGLIYKGPALVTEVASALQQMKAQ